MTKTFETPDGASVHRFTALDGVNIDFNTGTIHAILGENGAGKTTLMNALSGLIAPSAGEIIVDGRTFPTLTPARALAEGIAMVHQRPLLADSLSVLENAVVGLRGIPARLAERERRLRSIAADWDLDINLRSPARTLTPPQRLGTALLAALYREPDFLILDEPTAVLPSTVSVRFMSAAKRAASAGLGVILITHKLDEALRWAERITVLRHGRVVFDAAAPAPDEGVPVSRTTLASLLDPSSSGKSPENSGKSPENSGKSPESSGKSPESSGKSPESSGKSPESSGKSPESSGKLPPATRREGFEARGLFANPPNREPVRGAGFPAKAGEVTGIFGEPGAGLSTLEDILSGMLGGAQGTLTVYHEDGTATRLDAGKLTPAKLRANGIAMVPSNRSYRGSNPSLSITETLSTYRQNRFVRDLGREERFARSILDSERIEAQPSRWAGTLSGGQLQRLILARELAAKPAILILCEPEWGLDIRSAAELRKRLRAAADGGTTVVILTDSPEAMRDDGFYDSVHRLEAGGVS